MKRRIDESVGDYRAPGSWNDSSCVTLLYETPAFRPELLTTDH